MHNDSSEQTAEFIVGIEAERIAEKIGAAAPNSGYVWGFFRSRLAVWGVVIN